MGNFKDITSQRFGRLVVVELAGKYKQKEYQWKCQCDCGNEVVVVGYSLRSGNTKSCGCLQKEKLINRSTKHKLVKHPLYNVWASMKRRCYNKNTKDYQNYGGRGITVCKEWLNNFQAFYNWAASNGWKKHLKIDRIDNNDSYGPYNCRFATNKRNCRNTNKSKRWVLFGKEYPSQTAAAKALGVAKSTIQCWCGALKPKGKDYQKDGCYCYKRYEN